MNCFQSCGGCGGSLNTAHMSKRLLQGLELEQRARELGVDIQSSPRAGSSSGTRPRAVGHALQRRAALQSLQQFRERCFQSRGDFAER
jgi:hypothetical protein